MTEMKRLHNFFIDEKVPREWRDRVPLLVGDRGIAWVVGYRIAEWAKCRNIERRTRRCFGSVSPKITNKAQRLLFDRVG